MTALVIGATTLVAGWFITRWSGRGRPCPVLVAAFFDNRIAEQLGGTALLIERAEVKEGMRVLDAGCGPGRVSIPLARRVGRNGEVIALDIQQGMLDRAKANAVQHGLTNIRTLLGALGSTPGALSGYEQSFDRILLVTVLGEIPDQQCALRSLHHALKPDGILSVTEMIIDPDYVPLKQLKALAEQAGFRIAARWGSPLLATTNLVKRNETNVERDGVYR